MRVSIAAMVVTFLAAAAFASTASAQQPINLCDNHPRSVVPIGQCPEPQACPSAGAVTDPASNVGAQGATLNGRITVWSEAKWYFQYGTSPSAYTSTTPPVGTLGTGDGAVSAPVGGLSPGTTYYFRLVVVSCGVTTYGDEESLRTANAVAATLPQADLVAPALTGGATPSDDAPSADPQAGGAAFTAQATQRVIKAKKAKKHRKAKKHKKVKKHH